MYSLIFRFGAKVFKEYAYKCWYCGVDLNKKNHSIDHYMPDGNNCIGNLRPCCKTCNTQKGNRDIETFRLIKKIEMMAFPDCINSRVIRYMETFYDVDFGLPDYKFYFEKPIPKQSKTQII